MFIPLTGKQLSESSITEEAGFEKGLWAKLRGIRKGRGSPALSKIARRQPKRYAPPLSISKASYKARVLPGCPAPRTSMVLCLEYFATTPGQESSEGQAGQPSTEDGCEDYRAYQA